jgi:hypothetical protein
MHAARGSLSLAVVGLENLLADSPVFRAALDPPAANADEAKRHIHLEELLGIDRALKLRDQRPLAVIVPERHGYEQIGIGAGIDMGALGGVVAILAKNTLASDDPRAIVLDFDNWLGGVLDDLTELVGRSEYFPFRTIEVIEGPLRADLDERVEDDYWVAAVLFSHGVNP